MTSRPTGNPPAGSNSSTASRRLWPTLILLSALAMPARAAEFAPAREGLIVWLDAFSQRAARQSQKLPPLASRQPVDFLLEGAHPSQRAVQPVANRRPLLVANDAAAYLDFDGQDDFLALDGTRPPTAELTLFVLAAPRTNSGVFNALFASAALGQNDYTSGLNLDFGPGPTEHLNIVNVESAGASGFRDLLEPGFFNAADRPFGHFHVFTVRSRVGRNGNEFFLDGFQGGARDRAESVLGLDQIILGSRFYSNAGEQPPHAQNGFSGAIAEVLVYDRALPDQARQEIEQALLAKTAALHALLTGAHGHPLEIVKDPPIVQMLVPGFTIRELPARVGNLNNVRYRHDGKLVGLGYDGRIHLLTDSDGDGLEDTDTLFWDQRTMRGPLGIALTAAEDPRGDGVFVASKGKVSLILDRDRDGRAEEELVIATGWKEILQNVDTLGLAIDPKDGSIYFGRGCANFADPYLIDRATGRAQYDIREMFGTIQRLKSDFSSLETVCTGVRFTCALAFNDQGDLFATEQEGATWLANGNPLDELLHIEPGKHYGFPPRHPKHLPDVRDEPPVIEYGPQHQSTVGMVFNEGAPGRPHFGPDHWRGDALVCGESRGKLWRTKLAKSPLGYVAQNHLIACLGLLTVDACVSPDGDLVVACHSGPPDWGTGPAGQGRLFKIHYANPALPQPVLAWAAAPDEFRVTFNHPLDPADWAGLKDRIKIEAGLYVGAGDRFETIRPGYQVVRDQMGLPRRWVEVLGLNLSEDRRTLVLRVPRQTEPVTYAVSLPLPQSWLTPGGIRQHPQMDVQIALNGLAAHVTGPDGTSRQTVLPHPCLSASAVLAADSTEHRLFLQAANEPASTLVLNGWVDTSNPFVPAVQPGATLDWDMAADAFASATFAVLPDYGRDNATRFQADSGNRLARLNAYAVTNPNPRASGLYLEWQGLSRLIPTARLYVPWVEDTPAKLTSAPGAVARSRDDVKGNWLRGRHLFFHEATCSTCHTLRGEGMSYGPDLSNLIHRDRDSVIHDILRPSATINPDHPGTLVTLEDGEIVTGVIHSLDHERLILRLPSNARTEIPRTKVASLEPLKTSLMPEDLGQQLTQEALEDLLTFLLVNPLDPAPVDRPDPPAPAPRSVEEITRVLEAAPALVPASPPPALKPLRILLVAGPKDHGLNEHDYPLWLDRWSRLLALGDRVSVDTSMEFPSRTQLDNADVAVFYNANAGWTQNHADAMAAFLAKGGGSVYLHYAIAGGSAPEGVAACAGLAFAAGSRFRHGELDLVFHPTRHPITDGMAALRFTDESYWNLIGNADALTVLASSVEDGSPRPQLWTREEGPGRIVGCIPGHYTWTFDDPLYRILVLRAVCWAAREDHVDRLAELATIGTHVQAAKQQ